MNFPAVYIYFRQHLSHISDAVGFPDEVAKVLDRDILRMFESVQSKLVGGCQMMSDGAWETSEIYAESGYLTNLTMDRSTTYMTSTIPYDHLDVFRMAIRSCPMIMMLNIDEYRVFVVPATPQPFMQKKYSFIRNACFS